MAPVSICVADRPKPVTSLALPSPPHSSIPAAVGGVIFGVMFIALIAFAFYYANVCQYESNTSTPGHRGDFFRNMRSAVSFQPTAPIFPLSVRTDAILRTLNFHTAPRTPTPRGSRTGYTIPPPYEHPPSYETSISDHRGSVASPISPFTQCPAPSEHLVMESAAGPATS
ncbi:hypothetical protein BD309DRAFT_289956 [Dichomitus squalens]|uniref:Uncharacterized protein n=1 Tax=Dichomitus squalens TaxID=114155 RepID=A0A4Q9MA33_9APHY|nr:hypothetical protein BD311DRAFT_107060 [Dichomitus squalens]TBU41175.1 hypothetical protein BD309DRAFT_289956 [Dichomitus squalens]TBU58050.1 hypothetical protein BD310DRAFT_977645 [Dichomitus squalens]